MTAKRKKARGNQASLLYQISTPLLVALSPATAVMRCPRPEARQNVADGRWRDWQAPTDRAARFIDDRSDSVSGRFSISATRGQHHVPSSTLSASCATRKHRAAWR
jgi:hypothetical protein